MNGKPFKNTFVSLPTTLGHGVSAYTFQSDRQRDRIKALKGTLWTSADEKIYTVSRFYVHM